MKDSKKGLLLGLMMAAWFASASSSFAQGIPALPHTRMSGTPQPPKTTMTPTGTWLPKSIGYLKASNTGKDNQLDRKSTRLNSSHSQQSRMPSSA